MDVQEWLYQIAYRTNTAQELIHYLYQGATLYLDRKYALAQRSLLIQIKKRKNFTSKEEKIIRQFYKQSSAQDFKRYLPQRTWQAIQGHASFLGVHKYAIKQ